MRALAGLAATAPVLGASTTGARPVALRTRGRRHGPIVRLVGPSDVGALIKPFVFLDRVDIDLESAPRFGFHPHSGIATLTLLLDGGFAYEDSTGASGTMEEGGVEWMRAGGGVWHTGHGTGQRIRGYQLWVALPEALENGPPVSRYLSRESFPTRGPARVILGAWAGAVSPIEAPAPINYLDVRLKAGEAWTYDPPSGHEVAWIAVHEGEVRTPEAVSAGELAVFEESRAAIAFEAVEDTAFVLGSAVRHPHDLVLGDYSVHTSAEALARGEAGIRRVAAELRRDGKL